MTGETGKGKGFSVSGDVYAITAAYICKVQNMMVTEGEVMQTQNGFLVCSIRCSSLLRLLACEVVAQPAVSSKKNCGSTVLAKGGKRSRRKKEKELCGPGRGTAGFATANDAAQTHSQRV